MSESPVHQDLVASLLSHLAVGVGAVTHVAGNLAYPDPPKIGRHEADLYLVLKDGHEVIGEAKTGPDLDDPTSAEQLADFSAHRDGAGERAALWLCVPKGWRQAALDALVGSGGEIHYRVDVLEVEGLDAAPPPTDQE